MNNTCNNYLIRVDASKKIGAGHLIRCLEIADFFKSKNINAMFLSRSGQIEQQIINRGFEIKILPENSTIADELNSIKLLMIEKKIKVILLDINNYNTFKDFNAYNLYLENLRKLSLFVVSFEDFQDYPYTSDIVIIPYFGTKNIKLHKKSDCKYLLGPKYFVLREEFSKVKPVLVRKKIESILVTMGGSDAEGITLKVLKAMGSTELGISLKIIIGGFAQISDAVIKNLLSFYKGSYSIIREANNMAELMSESGIAVINSGLTKYETSAVGLPSIIISNNEYHSELMNDFAKYDTVCHLGPVNKVNKHQITEAITCLAKDYKKRLQMSEAGKLLVDGNGIERIFNEIPKEVIYVQKNTMSYKIQQ